MQELRLQFLCVASSFPSRTFKSLQQCHVKLFLLLLVNCTSCSLLQRNRKTASQFLSGKSNSFACKPCKRFFVAGGKSTKGKKTENATGCFQGLDLKKQKNRNGLFELVHVVSCFVCSQLSKPRILMSSNILCNKIYIYIGYINMNVTAHQGKAAEMCD